ncbi:hypothetical protein BH11ACT1_BH11ACT1_07790 [soil metagenome]
MRAVGEVRSGDRRRALLLLPRQDRRGRAGDAVGAKVVADVIVAAGLLWLVTFDDAGQATSVEAVPLRLTFCHTTLAHGEDARWVRQRFREACGALGSE